MPFYTDSPDLTFRWAPRVGAVRYFGEIWSGSTKLRDFETTEARYDYTFDMNTADGGPYRSITMKLKVATAVGTSANFATLTVANPTPAAPQFQLEPSVGAIQVIGSNPAERDTRGMCVWVSQSPIPANTAAQPTYKGASFNRTFYALPPGVTHYFRVAYFDHFGTTNLSLSEQLTAVPEEPVGVEKVADASSITAAPGTQFPPGGESKMVVFDLAQGLMAYWHAASGTYKHANKAQDIAGQLQSSQIASVAAGQITGQLSDAQLAGISAAKVGGQLTNSQIASIAAAKLTGNITGTQIADGAVTTAKIAAEAITSGEIAAGAVVAGKIAADAVTSTEIAAGAVTASEIAAGAVTAGKIAAGAVTATEISAGSVTTAKLAAGAITTEKLAAGAVTASTIDAAYTNTTVLQARQAVIDYAAINSLSALSAKLGSVTSGQWEMSSGAGWQYMRSASKWWGDSVNGFVMAARPETGSYFSEFRAASGNALVLEKKGDGPDVGGATYLLQVRDGANADRVLIDPGNSLFKFDGDLTVRSATIAPSGQIVSSDYVPNTSGVRIGGNGQVEIYNLKARGDIVASSVQAGVIDTAAFAPNAIAARLSASMSAADSGSLVGYKLLSVPFTSPVGPLRFTVEFEFVWQWAYRYGFPNWYGYIYIETPSTGHSEVIGMVPVGEDAGTNYPYSSPPTSGTPYWTGSATLADDFSDPPDAPGIARIVGSAQMLNPDGVLRYVSVWVSQGNVWGAPGMSSNTLALKVQYNKLF